MLHRAFQLLWFGFAALLILAAVAFSAARLLLPLMGDYRAQLETRLETLLQRPVSVERMDAAWRGFGPTLQLHQMRIRDETDTHTLLAVEQVWLRIDLLASLRQRALITSDTSLVGLDLDLVRRADGRIALRGMPLSEQPMVFEQGLAILHNLGDLSLLGTRLRWEDQTGAMPRLDLADLDLRLRAGDQEWWFDLNAPLPAAYGNRLRASLRVTGDRATPGDLRSNIFLQLEGAHLGVWSSLFPGRNLDLWGRLDLRLWGRMQGLQFKELALDFNLDDGQVTSLASGDVAPFIFTRLQSRLLWARLEDGWRLSAAGFELAENGALWPASRWRLEHREHDADTVAWRGEAEHLDLGALSRLLLSLPLPAALEEPLRTIAPQGRLTGLRFDTRFRAGEPDAVRLRSDFHELVTRPYERLPGIQSWSGHVDGDLDNGTLQLDIAAGGLDLQPLFRTALPVTEGGGTLHWRREDGHLSLYADRFRLANEEVAAAGRWRLDLPVGDAELLPHLDLHFSVERGQVASTWRYLPVGIMNERVVAWLDRALVAGEITGGSVLFHGPLRGFPFDDRQGRFEVRAAVAGAVLDYRKDWEPIHELQAQLIFAGPGMEILGHAGRIGATALSEVRAHTPDLRRAGPPLRITGRAAGELPDMLAFVEHSPLGGRYRGLTDKLQSEGRAGLELALQVPLWKEQGDFAVQGTVDLADNGLRIEEYALELEGLGGLVHFTDTSIGSRDLQARLWGAPLQLDLDTRPAREGGYHRIRLQGPVGLVARLGEWGWPLASRLEGEADWQAEIRIHPPEAGESTRLHLELGSDLRGIGVNLPAPLAKPAQQARPLRLWRSQEGEQTGPLWLQYGDDVQVVLELAPGAAGQRLVRGGVRLGTGVAHLPAEEMLQLVGRLPRLSLTDWLSLGAGGDDGSTAALPPLEIDLALDELEIHGRLLRELGVRARREDGTWDLGLSGHGAQGQVRLDTGASGLERVGVDLDYLHFVPMETSQPIRDERQLDPRTMPVLSIQVGELTLGGRLLGNLRIETQRRADGMRVEQLLLDAEDYRLQAQGDWVVTTAGTTVSRFELQLENGNLGALLEAFHHERVMESKRANARLVANWPGSPLEFNLDRIEGHLDLDIGSGQLAKLDAPAGRILNILSIHSLQRRLALDFSDVFGKGFSFDSITGHVSFVAGDAYTQDLQLQSPSAQIGIAGRTGFVARDYDQLVTITPLVSSNLPLAGVLAGGPAVGAALFVAERLFGERMNRLARYQYQVTGSWDEPHLERLSLTPGPGGEQP